MKNQNSIKVSYFLIAYCLIFMLFLISFPLAGQVPFSNSQVIFPNAVNGNDRAGYEVAIKGELLAIGIPKYGISSGSVELYNKDENGEWRFFQQLLAPDTEILDQFGNSVNIWGDYIIVGAHKDDFNEIFDYGSAYIYKKGPSGLYEFVKQLLATDGETKDRFGRSVVGYKDYAIVGVRGDDPYGDQSGSIYIYKEDQGGADNWGFSQKITAPFGDKHDRFGDFCSVYKGYLVVGAQGYDEGDQIDHGIAFLYKLNNQSSQWEFLQVLEGSDIIGGAEFGHSVSISDNLIIIGARYESSKEEKQVLPIYLVQ